MNALITGIGWVTVKDMGCGRDHNSFAMEAGQLPEILRKSIFDTPYQRFRKMDRYSRLGLAAVAFALKDAGLDEWTEKRNIGIIACSVYGCLGTDIDYFDTVIPEGGLSASPSLFSYTLPNCFLGEAAVSFGLTGASFVINEKPLSGLVSIRMALEAIVCGESGKMLCGICDLGCPPQLGGIDNEVPGALFFMIEEASKKNLRPYGRIGMMNGGDTIQFDGIQIESLEMLAQECLRNYVTVHGLQLSVHS